MAKKGENAVRSTNSSTKSSISRSSTSSSAIARKTKTSRTTSKRTTKLKSVKPKEKIEEVTESTEEAVVENVVFEIGDKVVYAAQGVGVIKSIKTRVVSGIENKFYEISILETGLKVSVPIGLTSNVGLRKIVDKKAIDKVYEILRDRRTVVDTQTWNRRFRQYQQKIKTGSVFEIAKVLRDLSVLKIDKELSFGERDMLKTARGRLVKEISIAKSQPEDLVIEELTEICDFAGNSA